jgi:hypothetical protein
MGRKTTKEKNILPVDYEVFKGDPLPFLRSRSNIPLLFYSSTGIHGYKVPSKYM